MSWILDIVPMSTSNQKEKPMITADEARKLSNEIRSPVAQSPEFKAIMDRIEIDIRTAIKDGCKSITIRGDCLPVYNKWEYPKNINRYLIDPDTFWVKYVKAELEKLGFKFLNTITRNTYIVRW